MPRNVGIYRLLAFCLPTRAAPSPPFRPVVYGSCRTTDRPDRRSRPALRSIVRTASLPHGYKVEWFAPASPVLPPEQEKLPVPSLPPSSPSASLDPSAHRQAAILILT